MRGRKNNFVGGNKKIYDVDRNRNEFNEKGFDRKRRKRSSSFWPLSNNDGN